MGRYLCLEPILPVAMRFHASRSAVTSALASPIRECCKVLVLKVKKRGIDVLMFRYGGCTGGGEGGWAMR